MINVPIQDKISITQANNYQQRKLEDDFIGSVYVLYFTDHDAVKIGLTNCLEDRFKQLKREFGEFEVVSIIDSHECFLLENQLHDEFKDLRICLEKGNGRTEFFKKESFRFFPRFFRPGKLITLQ